MTLIDPKEITVDPTSFVDPTGRVFSWRGEIYRAIGKDRAPFIVHLLEEVIGRDPALSEAFVETEITDLKLDSYELVLRHRRIPFRTYCTEWPSAMLKEAALLTLQIARRLAQHNMVLQDAHPYNVFFDGTRPYFIDLGSVVPAYSDHIWRAYDQFCSFFLNPIYLSSAGLAEVARTLLMDPINGVPGSVCSRALPFGYMCRHPRTFSRLVLPSWLGKATQRMGLDESVRSVSTKMAARTDLARARARFLRGLEREVDRIKLPEKKTHWSGYYRGEEASKSMEDLSSKDAAIRSVLREARPETLLDLGCNVGRYALMAAEEGIKVIASDTDEDCVGRLYREAKSSGLDIIPLVMSAIQPTPAFGWNAQQYPAATERLRADMVLALALVHHLAIHQMQNFERIVGSLEAFTDRWLVVEFVSREDPQASQMLSHTSRDYGWYELDAFIDVLEATFNKVTKCAPYSTTRTLFLCER